MTAALYAALVGRLRNSQTAATDPDCLTEQVADAIESLERQLAEADEVGSTLYFDGEPYDQDPAYAEFAAKRDRMIARHRERMKDAPP